jgi:hypothetical protein
VLIQKAQQAWPFQGALASRLWAKNDAAVRNADLQTITFVNRQLPPNAGRQHDLKLVIDTNQIGRELNSRS